ncbi:MAG: hypothetical protein HRT61_00855 [Ekhidna sp.]|nr:hypothetical protein [Ekhidna sp.]
MKIKLVKDFEQHKKGTVFETVPNGRLSLDVAKSLIKRNLAEVVTDQKPKPKRQKKESE